MFILDHNYWTENLLKSIKVSKDSDSSLISNKNFSEILWPSSWALGQAAYAKMTQKLLNTFRTGWFRGFLEKNAWTHVALRGNFSAPVCSTDLVKVSKNAASLVGYIRKKFFCLGMCVGCEWRHNKWRTFRPPWPTLPGPGCQPLGVSFSLKFLLETRLQSKSFDTLDDLLVSGSKVVM